jgi:POT family proton-dependent oligopeptide transporter
MIAAAVIQPFIYVKSPCGRYPGTCDQPLDLSVWVQTPAYVMVAFSKIFCPITDLEYTYTNVPKYMRSLVTGIFWFTHALSSAIAQAFLSLADDPLLVWLYVSITILAFLGWIGFSWTFRSLDKGNDALEKLPEGRFQSFLRTRIHKNCCNRESLIQLVCGESLSSQISSMVAQPSAVLK